MTLAEMMAAAKERGASDLLIMVGDKPAMRIAGNWVRFDIAPIKNDDIQIIRKELITDQTYETLLKDRELDMSMKVMPSGRIRVNMHFQRNHLAIVIRLLWPEIPRLQDLGVPAAAMKTVDANAGLILISGPTGSGKSTTLAAMIEQINLTRTAHVITIEDPIEFIFKNKHAIIEQREIGFDTHSWEIALRHVLRQSPDVIVLGELRDYESIQMALLAAETGHLVIASVHSSNAQGAILRMADVFPPTQLPQVRLQLSQSLRMVFCQRLVPGRTDETRVLMYETLMGTPAVQNVIRTNELEQLQNMMSSGRDHGMNTFEQCQREMIARGLVQPNFMNGFAERRQLSVMK